MTETSTNNKEETKECSCNTKESEQVDDCPANQHKVDGKCVDKESKVEQPKETSKDEIPSWAKTLQDSFTKIQTDYASLSGTLEKLKTLETQTGVREKPKPTTTIASDTEPFSLKKAVEKVVNWIQSPERSERGCAIEIPVDFLRDISINRVKTPSGVMETWKNPYASSQKITEALGFTGTQSIFGVDTDVALEPGSVSRVPTRQFAKQKVLGQGEDKARFFKHDLPTTATQTAGTTATEATMDIEAVEINPSTITGVYFKVDTDDIENNAYDTLGVVTNAAAFRYEDFVSTDMLDTVSAEGTLTPGKWIRADTGATITHSDTASIAFDPTGIATGVEYLTEKGYLWGGVKPVAFLHPQQFKELIEDTELTNYIAFSEPNAYRKNTLAELYGCQIVVTNTVDEQDNTTTDAYHAIMCIPQHSYGIAYKRNVSLKFHEYPEDNQIRVTANWRTKSGVIDGTSIVRMTSAKA